MNRTELIAAVREHALANYEQGWDVVVETFEDDEIATVIGKVRTVESAVKLMAARIEPYNERRREIESLADNDDYDPQMGTGSPARDHVANNDDDSVCRRCGAELVYDNPVPETFVQDVVKAEAQAHRIVEAIATGSQSAERHTARFPSWEMITTESGAFFSTDNDVVRRNILDQKGVLAQYLSGHAGFGSNLDLAIGLFRDQAFVIRLMELELKRREQRAKDEQEHSCYPRSTEAGPVCGNCTHYDGAGDRVIMRHATAQDVRDCYAVRYAEEQQALDELSAERRAERFFEEGF